MMTYGWRIWTAVIVLAFVALIWLAAAWGNEYGIDSVMIDSEFPGKIVYTVNTDMAEGPFVEHCRARGGTFNACGSPCAPGAEFCAEVCAYVCEIPEAGSTDWGTYTSDKLGFSIPYRADMNRTTQTSPYGPVIRFSLWGPTQEAATELYDGVSVSVMRRDLEAEETLEGIVEEDAAEIADIGDILEPVSSVELAGREGLQFGAFTVGAPHRRMYIPAGDEEVLIVSVAAPDPENEGHQQIADRMIDGFEIR